MAPTQSGTYIGPYKLVEEIGEGGMGSVFMALQKKPVRRTVALKVIKPGMDSKQVVSRFEAERQALAMMDHPNIAKVHDGGTTESGRPYFVMELVKGIPITDYCDDHRLTNNERLELFRDVCSAVHHAHQKGIIHRDLKPSNILVTQLDGKPLPKIIDFGIAKAISGHLMDESFVTGFSQLVGTPIYMSPEQTELTATDIDTRSDVYSMGVLLYQLITGITPFDRDRMSSVSFDEVRRIVREEDPPRPSTRLSTLDAALETVAEKRHTDPRTLSHEVSGELDSIVMKALEKDRTRRYESANELAKDVQRYLDDEPVEACPPSTLYRLSKFTRRHRTVAVATVAVALALFLGAGIATDQAIRATKAETAAEDQLQVAKVQQRLAEESAQRERDLRVEADAARKQAEQTADFLVEIFRSPDPERDGRQITVAEMLDKAKGCVEKEFFEDQPLQAKLLGAIGETYLGLGLIRESLELAQESHDMLVSAVGTEHGDTLRSASNLASTYAKMQQFDQALTLYKQVLRTRKEKLGLEHPDTLMAMSDVGDTYWRMKRFEESIPMFGEMVRLSKRVLGEDHPSTLRGQAELGWNYMDGGQPDKATLILNEAVQKCRKALPPGHPTTLLCMHNLGGVYCAQRQFDMAFSLLDEALKISKKNLRPEHPDALRALTTMAFIHWWVGNLDQSVPLFKEALALHRSALGEDHPSTLQVMSELGIAYLSAAQLDKGVPLLEETLRICQEKLGPEHSTTVQSMTHLAVSYTDAGRMSEAIPLLTEVIRVRSDTCGPEHPDTLLAMHCLADAYARAADLDIAIPILQKTLQLRRQVQGAEHRHALESTMLLGSLHLQCGEYSEAEPLLLEAHQGFAKCFAAAPIPYDERCVQAALGYLVKLYEQSQQPERAAEWKTKLEAAEKAAKKEDSDNK